MPKFGKLPDLAVADGFAAVDALVALVILATTISACLSCVAIAQKCAQTAAEMTQAQVVLKANLSSTPDVFGSQSGSEGRLKWIIETSPLQTANLQETPGFKPCLRRATAWGKGGERRYELATASLCQVGTAR